MGSRKGRARRPRVVVNCVADSYAGPGERIVEFSAAVPDGLSLGGLISFRVSGGKLIIQVYRADKGVVVEAGAESIPAHVVG